MLHRLLDGQPGQRIDDLDVFLGQLVGRISRTGVEQERILF
jgi:hypothetical protein